MLVPHKHCEGEPGEPLSPEIVALINAMVPMGYAPLDFGLDLGTHVEFLFIHSAQAQTVAAHFIRVGGYI